MVIDMNEAKVRTLTQVRQVLAATQGIELRATSQDDDRYAWIASALKRLRYRDLKRHERGDVLAYLRKLGGYGRAQTNRLVARWLAGETLHKRYQTPQQAFARRFTPADTQALIDLDRALGTLSGPATACALKRAYHVFGDPRYERLATISSSHLYNLRRRPQYLAQRLKINATRPIRAASAIGVRKAPRPDGRPGFIRIDSVHQGDRDGVKGLYHINAVDCVTQWEVVASVEAISEAFLLPVIQQMLAQFPFKLKGFHSDNGSEYVNHQVAAMLDKLRVEFTRSRPRRSNDNGLVETKNGAIVRKVFGYAHIPQRHASVVNQFNQRHLNPFINFHRPCLYPTIISDPAKPGRFKKVYHSRDVMTPLSKLASLARVKRYLKPGVTLAALFTQAREQTDIAAGIALQAARSALFRQIAHAA
jgi:transposase InsO family protein